MTFMNRPAEVAARNRTVVNFFPCCISDIIDKHSSGSRLEFKREWIAKSVVINISSLVRTREWIVIWSGPIRIYAKYFSEVAVEILCQVWSFIFACCDVEFAIRSKFKVTAAMIYCNQCVE